MTAGLKDLLEEDSFYWDRICVIVNGRLVGRPSGGMLEMSYGGIIVVTGSDMLYFRCNDDLRILMLRYACYSFSVEVVRM